jgi:hypothetical protein
MTSIPTATATVTAAIAVVRGPGPLGPVSLHVAHQMPVSLLIAHQMQVSLHIAHQNAVVIMAAKPAGAVPVPVPVRAGPRRSVCVVYTGGTMGMMADPGTGALRPVPNYLSTQLARMPELATEDMPTHHLIEYDPLLDSASMTPDGTHGVRVGQIGGRAEHAQLHRLHACLCVPVHVCPCAGRCLHASVSVCVHHSLTHALSLCTHVFTLSVVVCRLAQDCD